MAIRTEDLVERYVRRLREELGGLSSAQRQEIVDEVRNHVEESLADREHATEADVLNVLDRLGDPAEIAREAYQRFRVTPVETGFIEVGALILLPIGGIVLPGLGWIIGVILLWISSAWNVKEKLIGTLILPGGLAAAFFMTVMASPTACHIGFG